MLREWLKNEQVFWPQLARWFLSRHRCRLEHRGPCRGEAGTVDLIVPCDPLAVIGSRGDQAMILAIVQSIRKGDPNARIEILTVDGRADEALRRMGMEPQAVWNEHFWRWWDECHLSYRRVYILGADVTDGVYGWKTPMRLLSLYDLFFRLGTPVAYLGFSFGKSPSARIRRVMAFLAKGLPLPVRDPVSLERVERFTTHRPVRLVADVAFCLTPRVSGRVEKIASWCRGEHGAGRKVMAVNVHQMFNEATTRSEAWEEAFAHVLWRLLEERREFSLLFVAHDDRPGLSDLEILRRIRRRCPVGLAERVKIVEDVLDADEAKGLLADCDVLVAGRMHLSIAALGQGVPVFALVYQGKFEGLWAHFGLPADYLYDPSGFQRDEKGSLARLLAFCDDSTRLHAMIEDALPRVEALSRGQLI